MEEYIHLYLGFVLQEVQAQAIKSINMFHFVPGLIPSRLRRRCTIAWCRYDSSDNELYLFLDSKTSVPTTINTYSIIIPYLPTTPQTEDAVEFSFEAGKPHFHLPFFFGIMNTQSGSAAAPIKLQADIFQLTTHFPQLFTELDRNTPMYVIDYLPSSPASAPSIR